MAPSCNHWRGRDWKTQEEVVQCDAEVEVHQSRWQALVDADGCFVEWISPKAWLWRPTLEGDSSWETNNSHKGAQWTRDQGTSAQPNVKCARKTVSVQESEKTTDQVWSWPPLQLQTHRPETNYTNQTHTLCFFWHHLLTKTMSHCF